MQKALCSRLIPGLTKKLPVIKRWGSITTESHRMQRKTIFLAMKFTAFILLIACMQVSAGGKAQTVTLKVKDAPLQQVFQEIEKQTGYSFVYASNLEEKARKVTLELNSASINEALKKCFNNQPFTYKLINTVVIVNTKIESVKKIDIPPPIDIKGRIVNEDGKPVVASIVVKGTNKGTTSNEQGEFELNDIAEDAVLVISGINIEKFERKVNGVTEISLVARTRVVTEDEIKIVSTGYQDIPRERATGSFEVIDNKKLNLIHSPNILKRLEGNASDLDFRNDLVLTSSSNPRKPGILNNLTIRGQNTLYGNSMSGSRVLVVIDGVPLVDNGSIFTEDEISKLNPDDIESITILKDAAAQSVYGSKAANGVMVIKTKRAKLNQPMQLSFSTSFNLTEKPDLFYVKRTSTANYVDFQKELYGFGHYDWYLQTPNANDLPYAAPLVPEILDLQARGLITAQEAENRLNVLRNSDIRNDFTKYILRNSFNQNYNVAISNGSDIAAYRLSVGYSKALNNTVRSKNDRLNLNISSTFKPVKNLNISLALGYVKTDKHDQSSNSYIAESGVNYMMPYDRLADENGNALSIINFSGYRPGWVDTIGQAAGSRLLDWHYYPLKDLYNSYNKTNAANFTASLNVNYKITNFLSAELTYGYSNAMTDNYNLDGADSYFTRDRINYFTQSYTGTNPWTRNIPQGAIYTATLDRLVGQNLRGQLNFNKNWGSRHNLAGIIGTSFEMSSSETRSDGYYGYDERYKTYAQNMNFSGNVEIYGGQFSTIPRFGNGNIPDNYIRSTKSYVNAAYTYDNRYTVSGSIAKDAYNVFGVDRNKSFKPYWSTGLLWNINNEKFYNIEWLPRLALRTTFGYNGNTNYSYVPWPYIQNRYRDGMTNYDYVILSGLTNKLLRPEKVGQLNFGLDLGSKNGRLSGSVEYYQKFIKDLIGGSDIDPTSGYYTANYNIANMRASGISLNLRSVNIRTENFMWSSDFIYSKNRTVITNNKVVATTAAFAILSNNIKLEGNDVNTVYAIPWAGLDPTNGAPRYMLDGKPSTNYLKLLFNVPQDSLIAMGSKTPKFFGSIRNTFEYKGFYLSFNALFKLGYVFRRPIGTHALHYSGMVGGNILPAIEFDNRWQKPGDEAFTNVPAFKYYPNAFADMVYQNADINILKGDHIRIQEINLGYTFKNKILVLKNARLSGSVSHLGIIWRANKAGVDPDILDLPLPRNYSLSFSANF